MKILAIGDPHGSKKIKDIPVKKINPDLILLTGDLGKADLMRKMAFENIRREKEGLEEKEYPNSMKKKAYMQAYNSSMKIIKYLKKQAPVFFIYGNVEYSTEEVRELSKEIGEELPVLKKEADKLENVRIINNRVANFNGLRIGGLEYFKDVSWVKEFKPEDYDEEMEYAKKKTEKAKRVLEWFDKLDILLCHQPPYGVLDKVSFKGAPEHWKGKHAGSKVILNYIKKKHPKFVFCGHIHEGKGKKKVGKTEVYNLGIADYKVIG